MLFGAAGQDVPQTYLRALHVIKVRVLGLGVYGALELLPRVLSDLPVVWNNLRKACHANVPAYAQPRGFIGLSRFVRA